MSMRLVRTEDFTALGPRHHAQPPTAGQASLSVLLRALVLYAPPMNALFHTEPLPLTSLLPLPGRWAGEARKLWVRTMPRARP